MSTGNIQNLAANGSTVGVDVKGPVFVAVSEGTWGSGTLQIERQNADGVWKDVIDGSFTADFNQVIDFPEDAENTIRATLSGATGPDLDFEVQGQG